MGHFAGKQITGTHTSVIDGAEPVVKALKKSGAELNLGVMENNTGGKVRKMILSGQDQYLKLQVLVNSAKQHLTLFRLTKEAAQKCLEEAFPQRSGWIITVRD